MRVRDVGINAIDEVRVSPHEEEITDEEARQKLLSQAGQLMAQAHRKFRTECRECGNEIEGTSRRKFCGDTCHRRHWRRRKREMSPGDELPIVE